MGSFKQSTSQDEVRGRLRTGDPPGKRRSRERQTPNDLSGTSPVPAAGLDNGFCGTKKRRPVDPVVAMSLARGRFCGRRSVGGVTTRSAYPI